MNAYGRLDRPPALPDVPRTLIFLILHLLHPARDFLWDLLGGMVENSVSERVGRIKTGIGRGESKYIVVTKLPRTDNRQDEEHGRRGGQLRRARGLTEFRGQEGIELLTRMESRRPRP